MDPSVAIGQAHRARRAQVRRRFRAEGLISPDQALQRLSSLDLSHIASNGFAEGGNYHERKPMEVSGKAPQAPVELYGWPHDLLI